MIDKRKDHGNDVMVAQFLFLFLSYAIFRETSTKCTSNLSIDSEDDDYEYEIFSSFLRENVIAGVILQRVLARMS